MRVSLLQVGVSMSINRSVLLLSKPSSQSDYSLQVGVSKVLLSDLTSGRCSSRLLRFWEVRNVKHCGELMCVDLLLLDSKPPTSITKRKYVPCFIRSCNDIKLNSLL
ncbi:unnamed protein product [Brassica napus]|uniref:(rape) hypothetical protein n=1 Tax=Brassica napus TaxID=3708 RepID=A0A816LI17_BRANA|nr:unnamed protein product [Brassica napus]